MQRHLLVVFCWNRLVCVFAELGVVLQDGGVHKAVWHSRNGSKLCMLCKNLFTTKSEICDSDGTALLACGVCKLEDLVPRRPKAFGIKLVFLNTIAMILSSTAFNQPLVSPIIHTCFFWTDTLTHMLTSLQFSCMTTCMLFGSMTSSTEWCICYSKRFSSNGNELCTKRSAKRSANI